MEKNLVASLPVMRPSLSKKGSVRWNFWRKNKENKNHWKMCCAEVYCTWISAIEPVLVDRLVFFGARTDWDRVELHWSQKKLRNREFEISQRSRCCVLSFFYRFRELKTRALNDDDDLHWQCRIGVETTQSRRKDGALTNLVFYNYQILVPN